MKTPILSTKIYIPKPSSTLVPRQRLIDQLNHNQNCKLTLVSAPAGYGKTTLLSEWIQTNQRPCCWISLDSKDNDLWRFFSYMLASLKSTAKELDETIFPDVRDLRSDNIEAFFLPLINQLSTSDSVCTLVLDDYHLIHNQEVHKAMIFLLEHLPENLHITIATRSDPPLRLAKLRAQGELCEIRVDDLRFTAKEAVEFLNQSMKLEISTSDISTLVHKTEGWIVGLQLAGISLERHPDKHRFVVTFAGNDRYIADYLLEEALERQPEHIKSFLLQTSILDRLCAPLCDYVLGQENSQSILAELEQANLFLIALDNQRNWYRYHHLFAGLLQQHFSRTSGYGNPTELHKKACEWFYEQDLIFEALSHAVSAEDMTRLVRLIETSVFSILDRGEINTLVQWLEDIPESLHQSHPWLNIACAWAFVYAGKQEAGENAVQMAEESLDLLDEIEKNKAIGHIYSIRAYTSWMNGDGENAKDLAYRALEILPQDELTVRAFASKTLGGSLIQCNELPIAEQPLIESIALAKAAKNDHVYLLASSSLAYLYTLQGRVNNSEKVCLEVINQYKGNQERETPAISQIYTMLAEVCLGRNELDQALLYAQKGFEISKYWNQLDTLTVNCVYLVNILIAQRKFEEAENVLTQIQNPEYMESNWFKSIIIKSKAMIDLCSGDIDSAYQWLEDSGLYPQNEITQPDWSSYRGIAAILMAQGKHTEAISLLENMIKDEETFTAKGYLFTMFPMLSVAHMALGNKETALKYLQKGLVIAEPERYCREYIRLGEPMAELLRLAIKHDIKPEFAAVILEKIGEDLAIEEKYQRTKHVKSVGEESLIEALSNRELEVLKFISEGLTNQEIAMELYLSLYTVKSHARNIFSKLGVKNRTEAVAKARLFGLFPQE